MLKRSEDTISVDVLNQIPSARMCKVGSVTEVKTLAKSRIDKSPTPAKYQGVRKVSFFVGTVGNNYQDLVNNRLIISGNDAGFVADASSVSAPFPASKNGIMRMGLKNPDQKYIRIYFNVSPNNYNETIYIDADGNVLDIPQADMEAYFPAKSDSKKQEEHGLEKDIQVQVREFKQESIAYFQCGEVIWNNLGESFLNLFNLENV